MLWDGDGMIICTNPQCQSTAGCICNRTFVPSVAFDERSDVLYVTLSPDPVRSDDYVRCSKQHNGIVLRFDKNNKLVGLTIFDVIGGA